MAKLEIDFGKTTGRTRPLHGLCNGPVSFGAIMDGSHRYRELATPWVRLHDTNWPHPLEVNVPQIFPDFDADPDALSTPSRHSTNCWPVLSASRPPATFPAWQCSPANPPTARSARFSPPISARTRGK